MNIWQQWRQWTDDKRGVLVVGRIPGEAMYDLRGGEVYRVFPGSRRVLGTARRATAGELRDIQVAMDGGWFQIEARAPQGITSAVQVSHLTVILYQATGMK